MKAPQPQPQLRPFTIKVDAEGRKQIEALCDVALKAYGLSNLLAVNRVLASTENLPPQKPVPPTTQQPAEAQ